MRLRWLIPIALLFPLAPFLARCQHGQVTSMTIRPGTITTVRLRPDFESIIHLPAEVTSVVVGSPSSFHVEHNEAEPNFVYVKPIIRTAAQSNLLIAMKSGQYVVLQLVSDNDGDSSSLGVDFLLDYKPQRSFVVFSDTTESDTRGPAPGSSSPLVNATSTPISPLEQALAFQEAVPAPAWLKWEGSQIRTAIGELRQVGNMTLVAFSILNAGNLPLEIVPPQIQMDGEAPKQKKRKNTLSDQIQVRSYRLTTTRLEAGERTDGVLTFDRPTFKSSTQSLFVQFAQADQVDRPILVRLPFTAPHVTQSH